MESSRKRKTAPDFDRNDAESEMRQRKLKALEEHADFAGFSFIVGPEKESAELMHCLKFDLLAASDYFGGLLRSPCAENPPVWIKHIQPRIFKMVLKFVSVQTMEEDLTLEDAVALGLAADEFLLVPLKSFCASEVKRLVTLETVWNTLNLIVRIPDLPDACSQVLSLETKKCLEHESFLEASEESLIFLLNLETLSVDSEVDLIEAAIKLAKTKSEKEEVKMMKIVIPHLRLLTLPVDKFPRELSNFLSNSQMAFLAKRLMFKDENSAGKVSPPLNLSTSSRNKATGQKFKLEFIAEDLIKNDWQMMGLETKENTKWNNVQIAFVAAEHLVLKEIEILTRAKNDPKLEFVSNDNEASSRISTITEEYKEDMVVSVFITLKGGKVKKVVDAEVKSKMKYNLWFYFKFKKTVFVPKGAKCSVSVRSSNVYQLIPISHIRGNIRKAKERSEFSEFKFYLFEREKKTDKESTPKSLENDGDHLVCIKSLSVVPVDEQGRFHME